MLPIVSALGWAVVTVMALFVWIRIIKKARQDPSYIDSLKEAGLYQRYQIGRFFSFILFIIAILFFFTSMALSGLV